MEKLVITITLIVLAAIFKALMDLSSEDRFNKSWWDKSTGWRNKYKLGKVENGPAFPGSTTVLVFLTDGWHLFQFLFLSCIEMAIAIQFDQWWWYFIGIKIILSGSFELIYSQIKKRL